MPYPFIQWPTLAEFVGRVKQQYGGTEREVPGLVGPRGPTKVRLLERDGGRWAILPDDDGSRLSPSVVRSLCERLGIPPKEFGFTIDDWGDDADDDGPGVN